MFWALFARIWYLFYMIHYCHFQICDVFITDVESLNVFIVTELETRDKTTYCLVIDGDGLCAATLTLGKEAQVSIR